MIHCNESIMEFWKKEKKLLAENFQLNKIIKQIYTLLPWKKCNLKSITIQINTLLTYKE